MAFAGEGEGVGAVSDLDHVDALAVVDGVDADGVGAEVADPEGCVAGGDDSSDGLGDLFNPVIIASGDSSATRSSIVPE